MEELCTPIICFLILIYKTLQMKGRGEALQEEYYKILNGRSSFFPALLNLFTLFTSPTCAFCDCVLFVSEDEDQRDKYEENHSYRVKIAWLQ